MLVKTLCLTGPAGHPMSDALAALGAKARRDVPGLQLVQVDEVVRQIPTDYLAGDKPPGLMGEASKITASMDFHFADAKAAQAAQASPAWASLMKDVAAIATPLFSLDSEPNIAVALRGTSVDGGFRRWLLLTRRAETVEGFREAWFGRHAGFVRHLPLLEGYVQNLVKARYDAAGKPLAYDALPVDGIAEVCYASEDDMNTSYASKEREPLKDDGVSLNRHVVTVLVQGRVVR